MTISLGQFGSRLVSDKRLERVRQHLFSLRPPPLHLPSALGIAASIIIAAASSINFFNSHLLIIQLIIIDITIF